MFSHLTLPSLLLVTLFSTAASAFEYTDADIEIAATDYTGISDSSRWFATGDAC